MRNVQKWTTLYQMINQANLAIKYIPNISMPDVADRNDYLGQAYALRALAYFYAIRVWGDVPLFIEPTEKYSEAIYKERTDKNYILEHVILPDLKKAEGLINRNRITNVNAFLSVAYGPSWRMLICGLKNIIWLTRPSIRWQLLLKKAVVL